MSALFDAWSRGLFDQYAFHRDGHRDAPGAVRFLRFVEIRAELKPPRPRPPFTLDGVIAHVGELVAVEVFAYGLLCSRNASELTFAAIKRVLRSFGPRRGGSS